MKQWVKLELTLILACLIANGYCFWRVSNYASKVEITRQTPAQKGQRYLNTCDGRATGKIGDLDISCLADYPGEFSSGVILVSSIALFFIVNLLYWAPVIWRRNNSSP